MYVDVHTHLTHQDFDTDRDQVIKRAIDAGLEAIVVNGLEPISNRSILAMAKLYPQIKAALGIYPVDAVNDLLSEDFPHRISRFSVQEELNFIRIQARSGQLTAIGECGLDGYHLDPSTYARQEEVFTELIDIARESDLPLIIHTRKLEKRALEMCEHYNVKKLNFHCFGGRTKHAIEAANKHNWYFSIPANAERSESFQKMLKDLPSTNILTETDAPYLGPEKATRNEPANVVRTIKVLAKVRNLTEEEAKNLVWQNYLRLFTKSRGLG